jgi:hypothetical protein
LAPNNGYGVGRVVREIYADLTFSPVYFIRYNTQAGWNGGNTPEIAFYGASSDGGFVAACDELLSNRVVTQQWWEEERMDDTSFFTLRGAQAASVYTAADGALIAVFKNGLVSQSTDGGETWSDITKEPSLVTSTGKVWAQRTDDGKFALVCNPTPDAAHRWPLTVVTGEDGRGFGDMLAVHPEISPCRYRGKIKNLGAQYVRGIHESNPSPPDGKLWLAYSVNKEDVWVASVPLPVTGAGGGDVDDDFTDGAAVDRWNLYVPKWCPVTVCDGCLTLRDRDPYDRARAERVFTVSQKAEIDVCFMADPAGEASGLLIEIQNAAGAAIHRFIFDAKGYRIKTAGSYHQLTGAYGKDDWLNLSIIPDCALKTTQILLTQAETTLVKKTAPFCADTEDFERIVFATKPDLPFNNLEDIGRHGTLGGFVDADYPCDESVYRIRSLSVTKKDR